MVTCTGNIGIHEGADGRTDVDDVMAIKPNFLTSMGYHIFLTMVLRAPLLLFDFVVSIVFIRFLLFLARAFVYVESNSKHFRLMSFLCFRLSMGLC